MTRSSGQRKRYLKLDPLRVPAPDTKLRHVYDLLLTGEVLTFKELVANITHDPNCVARLIADLSDYYNCEIIKPQRGQYRLTGRWDGTTFIPVEKLASLDMADHT